ncbi:MAG: hypothetical protein ACR2P0_08750 [Acidimicrobiales bacterium]
MVRALALTVFGVALLLSGCGSDDASGTTSGGVATTEDSQTAPADTDDLEAAVDDLAEDLEAQQQSQGGGSATLTVGDQTWTFAPVLCAFGEEQIGQEGAVFNLSGIQDGMQMYAAVDAFGHSVSLNDIENFEDPSVDLSSMGGEFLSINGKNISGDAEFNDGTTEEFTGIAGDFSATCP